jgi:Peptidase family M23
VPPFEREPEHMPGHRTTARRVLLLLLIFGLAAGSATARPGPPGGAPAKRKPAPTAPTKPKPASQPAGSGQRIIFPVVGQSQYTNDFGAPRSQGAHQGIDIMAARRALAVAAEGGAVKFHTSSWAAGCMLYLYGKSGTTYLYIHLNNDLTAGNDNRGKCVAGTAYAPGLKNGARVVAGQPIGYVGDSGDANGVSPHLHFEVHPRDKGAVNPYPYLNRATRLLFAAQRGKTFTLALSGTAVSAGNGLLELKVDSLRAWPGGFRFTKVGRALTVTVPESALIERTGVTHLASLLALSAVKKGQKLVVWTAPAPCTLEAQMGRDGALSAARVVLAAKR